MNIPNYISFLKAIISRIETQSYRVSPMFRDRHNDLASRCQAEQNLILSQVSSMSQIEHCPRACLTIAISSYLLQQDAIFYLDLPDPIHELLFHTSVLWIYSDLKSRNNIYEEIEKLNSHWREWCNQSSRDWCQEKVEHFVEVRDLALSQVTAVLP